MRECLAAKRPRQAPRAPWRRWRSPRERLRSRIADGIGATVSTSARSRIVRSCASRRRRCARRSMPPQAASWSGRGLPRRCSTRRRVADIRSVRLRCGPGPRIRRSCRRSTTARARASRDGPLKFPREICSGRWLGPGSAARCAICHGVGEPARAGSNNSCSRASYRIGSRPPTSARLSDARSDGI